MSDLHTPAYRLLRTTLREAWAQADPPCWLCGQPIDWQAPANTPDAFELDHALPRKTHPHLTLDPGNARPSHHRCNRSRGTAKPAPQLGATSEAW